MSPPPRSTGMLPISSLSSLAMTPFSSISMVTTTVHLAVSPSFLTNLKAGVQGQLAPHVNRYFPPLKAIMLGYDQLKLTSRTGALVYDSPQVHIDVEGMFFLFSPEIGGKLPGVVNKKSQGHLGCLVHDTFNVSLLAGEGEREVKVGSQVMMEVTRVVWGHKSMPIIQGKLVSKEQMEVEEADFDSGIDSTLSQKEVKVKKNKKRKREEEEVEAEEKVKKSKKRKKEVEEEEEVLESLQIKKEVVDGEEIKSKKKKKRKKEDLS